MQAPVVVMSELSKHSFQPERIRADLLQTRRPATDKWVAKHNCRISLQQKRKQWKIQLAKRMRILKSCSVADIIRSCLGPKAMLKMLLDPMGGIVLTNDGHAILREIEVAHPAAKSMIELSRTQDEEVGDGTTTVIILGMPCYKNRGIITDYW